MVLKKINERIICSLVFTKLFFSNGVRKPMRTKAETNEMFNFINLNKYDAYMLINKAEELSVYIPATEKVEDYSQIIKFAWKYGKVILRPLDFSICKETYFLEVIDNVIKITECTKLQSKKLLLYYDDDLKQFLQSNNISYNNYFIQRCIKVARVGELSYDVRVDMKRKGKTEWNCYRFQFKVGRNKFLLNDILNNSKEIYLKKVFKKSLPVGCSYDIVTKQVNSICQRACKILQQNNPHLFECEFDIAIDKEKKIWIIDINVLNSFKEFQKVDYTTYFSKEHNFILYVDSINNFKEV
jgi:hypothetical protein